MKRKVWMILLPIVLVLTLGVGLFGGIAIDRQWLHSATVQADGGLNVQLLNTAWNTIQQNYVDRPALKPDQLTYGAISGLVDALGDTDHSRFLTPDMLRQETNYEQGQFEGIGAEVGTKDGHVIIIAPFDGSPAQQAKLQPGDIIEKVDGRDMVGQPLSVVVNHILGPAGTSVTLTIIEPSTGNVREVTLQRARITLHNVTWQQLPGTTIAHLRLAGFSKGVTQDLQQALNDIQHQGLTGIVLDLRNNPGGLLDEAVGVGSQFLSGGNVLQEKNAQGEIRPVPVRSGGTALQIPTVVLINKGTASAAEIVAGALQDAQRAKLVGETTVGTGTVLNQFPLPDGSALLLAIEEWLTPNGRTIWHQGIAPDVPTSLTPNVLLSTPEAERSLTAAQLQTSPDAQLLKALSLLTSPGTASNEMGSAAAQPVHRVGSGG